MLRLCSDSSRSYTPQGGTILSPGRPAWHAVQRTAPVAVTHSVTRQESAEVIVGADAGGVARRLETSRGGIDAEASPHRRTEHGTGEQTQ